MKKAAQQNARAHNCTSLAAALCLCARVRFPLSRPTAHARTHTLTRAHPRIGPRRRVLFCFARQPPPPEIAGLFLLHPTVRPPASFFIMSKLLQLAAHPDEVVPVVRMLAAARRAKALPALKADPALKFCYEMLNRVSRR